MQRLLHVMPILGLFGMATAQQGDATSTDPVARARNAFQEASLARSRAEQEVASLKETLRNVGAQSAEREELTKQLNAAVRAVKTPFGPFYEAFRGADWSKFDPKQDRDLLETGLTGVSADLQHADTSVAASRMLLRLQPDHHLAPAIRLRRLPLALLSLDKGDECTAGLRDAAATLRGALQAQAFLTLGDVLAVMGDTAGAQKAYADCIATGQKEIAAAATLHAASVGQPVPGLEASKWIGSDPIAASAMEGKVRMLVFFATHAPPGRAAAAWASAMHDARGAAGLATIVVTRPFGHGYLPRNENELEAGGIGRQGMKPEEFVEHLRDYHTNTKMHCPIAVSDEATFGKFGVKQLPMLVLVGRDDKIVLATSVFEDAPVLEFGIRSQLAKK